VRRDKYGTAAFGDVAAASLLTRAPAVGRTGCRTVEEEADSASNRFLRSLTLGWPEGEAVLARADAALLSRGLETERVLLLTRGGTRVGVGTGGYRRVVPSPFVRREGRGTEEAMASASSRAKVASKVV
jgi:hypothetical protein